VTSIAIQLQAYSIIYLGVCKRDVVLVDVVPLLNAKLVWSGACLCCDQLLQISKRIILTAQHIQVALDGLLGSGLFAWLPRAGIILPEPCQHSSASTKNNIGWMS
jgi:hypothetical protein